MGIITRLILVDPEDLGNYFNKYIPNQKAETLVASVLYYLDRAEFLADLYKTPNFELETLKQKVDIEWKKRSLVQKFWDTFEKILRIGLDRPEEVRKEIAYRRDHTRGPEEWKQPFINLADKYKRKEFEEVRDYILNDATSEYQQKHMIF